MSRDKRLDLAGRRRFMQILSSMGVSAGAIATLSQNALAKLTDDPTDQIPILAGHEHNYPDGYDSPPVIEPVFETVDYDRHAKIQAAYNAAEKVERELYNNLRMSVNDVKYTNNKNSKYIPSGSTKPITVGVKYNTSSKLNTDLSISVNYKKKLRKSGNNDDVILRPSVSKQKVQNNIPTNASGEFAKDQYKQVFDNFPVILSESVYENEYHFNSKYDSVPGGVEIEDTQSESDGTTTSSFYHLGRDERVIVTSGHVVEQWSGAEQPGGLRTIADSSADSYYEIRDDFDAGWYDVSVDQFPGIGADGGGTEDWSLTGTRSLEWLQDEGYYTEFTKQGRTTGRTDGTVESIGDATEHEFDSTCASDDGDSGGIYYQKLDEDNDGDYEYYIVGLHNWAGGRGNGIERVEESLNVVA